MTEKEIKEKIKITEDDKRNAYKEFAVFALVAFCLYLFQLVLPPVLRFIMDIIHSFTK